MTEFVHLHVHSHYSLLDSTVKIGDLAKHTAAQGMNAVAVTDHASMSSCIEFQKYSKNHGVKPIFGFEAHVIPDRADARSALRPCSLVLLAESLEGYRNLVRLVSLGWRAGVDKRGRALVDRAEVEAHSAGVIALGGDLGGEVTQALLRGDTALAEERARDWQRIFGRDNFFLQLERIEGLPETIDVCDATLAVAEKLEIPVVATNNVHYLKSDGWEAHAVLMCIGMDKRVDRAVLERIPVRSLYLRSPQEMAELFADVPDAIHNTVRIAERCNVVIPTGKNYLPSFPVPEGDDEQSLLARLAREGLDRRFAEAAARQDVIDTPTYLGRLEREIGLIQQMGFSGYFLIVQDFINWAKEHDIPVGPGRGSGAGSIVAWSLRITDIDPIPYALLFERFLNPERVSMPDFDIDFCQDRRGEVIQYVTEKYGRDNVGQIVTFGQLKAKAVVRDVSRVLNLSYAEADRLAKLVPDELNIKLSEAYDREPAIRDAVNESETIAFLWRIGLALEGLNRNTGMHAAGVVISGEPLWEYVPILVGGAGEYVTQYAKNEVEDAGLVKFDFLGLKTLTVVADAVRLANRALPAEKRIDLTRLKYEDDETYRMIAAGDTVGIFQMESAGFTRKIKSIRPNSFEDVVSALALYRPGPLDAGMVDDFIDRKHGRKEVEYPYPTLEEVLKPTYGVIVYQEQVMQVAQVLAGYSLGGADLLRRAMGKKKPEEMDKQRSIFVEGADKNGISATRANEIFDLISHFAGYGFNKSHSAAYGVVTFYTAWLKRHYPSEFYAALMTNDASSTAKVVRYITDARAHGIKVLPPDVNASDFSFTTSQGAIRFGLGAIKGIGSAPIEAIVEARTQKPFKSLFDFCERVDLRRCNKRVFEALIRAGAFDSCSTMGDDSAPTLGQIGRRRALMFASIDSAMERGAKAQRDKASGQASLFGMMLGSAPEAAVDNYVEAPAWDPRTVLTSEKETLGFYVSGHPLDRFRAEANRFADSTTETVREAQSRIEVRIACVLSGVRERPLKSGEGKMAFFNIEDHFGEVEAVVYARVYNDVAQYLNVDEPMLVKGMVRVTFDEGNEEEKTRTLMVDSILPLAEMRNRDVTRAYIEVDPTELSATRAAALDNLLRKHSGHCRTHLRMRIGTADVEFELPPEIATAASDSFVNELTAFFGEERVRFR